MSSETVSNAFCFVFYFNLIFSFGSCLNAESLMAPLVEKIRGSGAFRMSGKNKP